MASVMEVLRELDCAEHAILCVYNKMDAVEDETVLPLLRRRFGGGISVSALRGDGLGALRERIGEMLDQKAIRVTVEMPPSAGRLQAFLSEHAQILSREYGAERARFAVDIAPRHLGRIRKLGGAVRQDGRVQEPLDLDHG